MPAPNVKGRQFRSAKQVRGMWVRIWAMWACPRSLCLYFDLAIYIVIDIAIVIATATADMCSSSAQRKRN